MPSTIHKALLSFTDGIRPAPGADIADALASMTPVILMGRGHSGTRVFAFMCEKLGIPLGVAESLRTGDVSDMNFQLRIKALALGCLRPGMPTENDLASPHPLVGRCRHAARQYHKGLGSPTGLWGWKFPETYLIGPLLARVFPEARYVHLIRDGRDIAFKEHLTDDPTRPLGRRVLELAGALDEPHHIQAAMSWAWQVDAFDRFRAALPEPSKQMIDLRFEDVCLDPHGTAERLCRFLGIEMTDACRAFLDDEIIPGKVRQHRENKAAQVAGVEARVRPTLERYGYLDASSDGA